MLVILTKPKWYDLQQGARIQLAPINDTVESIARDAFLAHVQYNAAGDVDFTAPETWRAMKARNLALIANSVTDWEGIGNDEGSDKLEVTVDHALLVLAQPGIYDQLFRDFLDPYYYRISEKNGSSPSRTGTSATAATPIVPDASAETDAAATAST